MAKRKKKSAELTRRNQVVLKKIRARNKAKEDLTTDFKKRSQGVKTRLVSKTKDLSNTMILKIDQRQQNEKERKLKRADRSVKKARKSRNKLVGRGLGSAKSSNIKRRRASAEGIEDTRLEKARARFMEKKRVPAKNRAKRKKK